MTSNVVYVGPPGVHDLHCERIEPGCIKSVWWLTPEERRAIAAGSNIALVAWTEPIPPISLWVTDEQGTGEDDPATMARLAELVP